MDAAKDVLELMEPGEAPLYIVFGPWGWGSAPTDGEGWRGGYSEPGCDEDDGQSPPVPFALRGKLLPWNEATPFMAGWSFHGGYGSPACYAVYIWTDRRVFWVTQYDGATELDYAPTVPAACMPNMPGG